MMQMLMQIDAGLLLIVTACTLILAEEDGSLTWVTRLPVLILGAACLAQAFWLLGIWIPNAAGYPWPRLVLDGALTLASLSRVIVVLVALHRNSGRLFATRPFGVRCHRSFTAIFRVSRRPSARFGVMSIRIGSGEYGAGNSHRSSHRFRQAGGAGGERGRHRKALRVTRGSFAKGNKAHG